MSRVSWVTSILGAATAALGGRRGGRGGRLGFGGLLGQRNPGRQERGDSEPANFQDMKHLGFPPVFRDAEARNPRKSGVISENTSIRPDSSTNVRNPSISLRARGRDRHGAPGGPPPGGGPPGHRAATTTLYPPMSTTLERLEIPVATGFAAGPRSAGHRRGRRRERRPPRQRRGGGGGPARPPCPLAATGRARAPAAGKDLDRHHGDPRQDDDLGADGLAAPRFRTGSRASSSAAR